MNVSIGASVTAPGGASSATSVSPPDSGVATEMKICGCGFCTGRGQMETVR